MLHRETDAAQDSILIHSYLLQIFTGEGEKRERGEMGRANEKEMGRRVIRPQLKPSRGKQRNAGKEKARCEYKAFKMTRSTYVCVVHAPI